MKEGRLGGPWVFKHRLRLRVGLALPLKPFGERDSVSSWGMGRGQSAQGMARPPASTPERPPPGGMGSGRGPGSATDNGARLGKVM